MDQQSESNQNQNATQTKGNNASSGAQSAPNVSTLLDDSSLPRPVCEWIKCLRAPAMSLSVSVDKQHIPNYDAAQGGNGLKSTQASGTQASGAEGMSFSHRCTVRYFDLALGAVAVMLLGCLFKTCTGCKRAMKRWF